MTTALQIRFVKDSLPAALAAGTAFAMNPNMILAQAAFESGWGQSRLSTDCCNFFGLTAYGCSNAYWHGARRTVQTSSYSLDFRCYASRQDSFMDFARLIRNSYRRAWQMSNDPQAYAKEIAYSPYLSELCGDDRETYRRSLVQIERTIQAVIELLLA